MAIFGLSRTFFKKFKFVVEIAGIVSAAFQTCSEVSIEVAVVEHWEGGSLIPNKSPGRVTIPNLVLARGSTKDLDAYAWMQQVVAVESILDEPDHERPVSVVQQDRRGGELRRWNIVRAWPVKFKAGDWDNGADEVTIEELHLAYAYPVLGGDNPV